MLAAATTRPTQATGAAAAAAVNGAPASAGANVQLASLSSGNPLADAKQQLDHGKMLDARRILNTAITEKQLADDAKTGDLQAAARKAGATFGDAPRFSRAKPAEKLPGDVQIAALQTPAGETSSPVRTPQGYYVVKVLERAAAGPVDAAEREKLKGELVNQKQSQTWERWVLAARGDAKIDIVGQRPPRRG